VDRAVNVNRDDGGSGLRGHERRTVVDLHERAGLGNPAFREDDHRRSAVNEVDDGLHRHGIGCVHHQVREKAEAEFEIPDARDAGVDQVGGPEWEKRADQDAVEKRGVIGDDQQAIMRPQFSLHLDAKEQAR
jgi:hypothetical protein